MTEREPTHILAVRVQNWTRTEYITPGLVAPKDETTEYYRGTPEDCDAIAEAKGILHLIDEILATEEMPQYSRVYLEPNATDPGVTELWCLARPIGEVTLWVAGLPVERPRARSIAGHTMRAGLTLRWSDGQTEGHVPRLKLVMRQAYGRPDWPAPRSTATALSPNHRKCGRYTTS
jgi:hypothetical protein